MARKTIRESQTSYTVQMKANETLDKPIIVRRNGKRFAALVPLTDYQEFVAWKKKHRALTPKSTRRARVPRKRKQSKLTDLIGIIQAEPSGEKIDFSEFMNKHGYEQIDRDDS
ncbi:MAG: hypothetical protein HY741_21835 [Chloroflexi bacterium]|nr:hypothetical protein [Chloroflexota bacterium]